MKGGVAMITSSSRSIISAICVVTLVIAIGIVIVISTNGKWMLAPAIV